MANDEIFSEHIFIFPFRMKNSDAQSCAKKVKDNGWSLAPYELNDETYSEFSYFYDYARQALYNSDTEITNEKKTSYEFKKILSDMSFEFEFKEKEYKLDISSIRLKLFDTGIATLTFELLNRKYNDFEDILIINDVGRRVYPQFANNGNLGGVKWVFLPNKIRIGEFACDFENYKKYFKEEKIAISEHILGVLGKAFSQNDDSKIIIDPVLDDRMFTMCYYADNGLVLSLQNNDKANRNGDWYRYVFVDGADKTCQSEVMSEKLLRAHTYDRWANWGTYWGVTRYSFMCLTTKGAPEHIKAGFKTMYKQIAILLIAQRASVVKFSQDVTEISEDLEKNEGKIKELYAKYIKFNNKLFFREVTAQEQGIELYKLGLSAMDMEKHVKELDIDIAELHKYADITAKEDLDDNMKKLTLLATLFGVISAILTAMQTSSSDIKFTPILIVGIIFTIALAAFIYFNKKAFKQR